MPTLREHCKQAVHRYTHDGRLIHQWMDEPVKTYGGGHRKFRHDPDQTLPDFLIEIYGKETAKNIMLDHIILDEEETRKKRKQRKRTTSPNQEELTNFHKLKPITDDPKPELTWGELFGLINDFEVKLRKLEQTPDPSAGAPDIQVERDYSKNIYCPNCKETVPNTYYCLNCGFALYKLETDTYENITRVQINFSDNPYKGVETWEEMLRELKTLKHEYHEIRREINE